jgi:hypothetical protein
MDGPYDDFIPDKSWKPLEEESQGIKRDLTSEERSENIPESVKRMFFLAAKRELLRMDSLKQKEKSTNERESSTQSNSSLEVQLSCQSEDLHSLKRKSEVCQHFAPPNNSEIELTKKEIKQCRNTDQVDQRHSMELGHLIGSNNYTDDNADSINNGMPGSSKGGEDLCQTGNKKQKVSSKGM